MSESFAQLLEESFSTKAIKPGAILTGIVMSISPDVMVACDAICAPGSAVANFHNSAPWMKMRIGE